MKGNIQKIREACIKANEEIVELKFGCETSKGVITSVFESEGRYGYAMIPYTTRWDGTNGEASAMRYGKENFEIIGRPIRLADVMLAIKRKQVKEERSYVVIFIDILTLWDLELSLENQSPETLQFIADLL